MHRKDEWVAGGGGPLEGIKFLILSGLFSRRVSELAGNVKSSGPKPCGFAYACAGVIVAREWRGREGGGARRQLLLLATPLCIVHICFTNAHCANVQTQQGL